MKRKLPLSILLVFLLASFVAYTLISTGFFREVNNTEGYEIIAELPLKGAEDFTIDYENEFMVISQDDRGAFKTNSKRSGGLFLMSLRNESFAPVPLKSTIPLFPHGISLLKLDSSRHLLFVVNHFKKHTIEKFELRGDSLTHLATYEDPSIVSPNDVVALDESRFYFTNDHGYTSKFGLLAENYLGLAVSNAVFYDGENFREVAAGIGYANGINISQDRSTLFVASPRKFTVKYYHIEPDGDLTLDRDLYVGSGIDNIEIDQKGNLWMGSHPNLLRFTAYAAGKKPTSPSEIIKVSNEKEVTSLFENDGSMISASSVAAPYKELLFVGTVMDDCLVVLKKRGD